MGGCGGAAVGWELGRDWGGTIADGVALVVKDGDEAGDGEGGGEDAFLCALGAVEEDGGEELQGVEAGVEFRGGEEGEEDAEVFLSLNGWA